MRKKITFVTIVALCIAHMATAQSNKEMSKKEREAAWREARLKKKAQERALEEQRDSLDFMQAIHALQSGSWALEASSITFVNGYTEYVTPSTNFVSINDGTGIVQTAFDNTNTNSPNGLGGVTLEGNITGSEMSRDKDGNIYYSYGIQGANISATVHVTLNANSNDATAFVSPNFSGNNMTMQGTIYPYENAGVFEGTPGYFGMSGSLWFAPQRPFFSAPPPPPMISARPPIMRPPMIGARPPMMRPPMGGRPVTGNSGGGAPGFVP